MQEAESATLDAISKSKLGNVWLLYNLAVFKIHLVLWLVLPFFSFMLLKHWMKVWELTEMTFWMCLSFECTRQDMFLFLRVTMRVDAECLNLLELFWAKIVHKCLVPVHILENSFNARTSHTQLLFIAPITPSVLYYVSHLEICFVLFVVLEYQ